MGFVGNSADFQLSLQEIAKDFFHDPIEVERRPWRSTPTQKIEADKQKLGTKPIEDMVQLGAPVATFRYLDVNGNILATVWRYEPDGTRASKTFRPHCFKLIDGVTKLTAGMPTPRPLYKLPEIAKTSDVVLVEGEGKADALAQAVGMATTALWAAPMRSTKPTGSRWPARCLHLARQRSTGPRLCHRSHRQAACARL